MIQEGNLSIPRRPTEPGRFITFQAHTQAQNRPEIMKNMLRILVCLTVLTVLPVFAGECQSHSCDVDQRLRETDLSLALRQYERVKMEAFETRLKLDLLDTEEGMTEVARKTRTELLRKRFETLIRNADELRELALNLEGKIKVAQTK